MAHMWSRAQKLSTSSREIGNLAVHPTSDGNRGLGESAPKVTEGWVKVPLK
ncbi:hypothetical protein GCM10025779_13030 [Arthrobacter cryoconiti]